MIGKQILLLLLVDYSISPLSLGKFSNFKALSTAQALKFENLSQEEKYHHPLIVERKSIYKLLSKGNLLFVNNLLLLFETKDFISDFHYIYD